MSSEESIQGRRLMTVWVVVSSVVWAAVVISTGELGWPLIVWSLTTFAPIAEHRRRRAAATEE